MANDISVPTRAGSVQRSRLLDGMQKVNDDLANGVAISFPILSISPGKWTVRWKGEEQVIPVPGHPDIATPWIDVVILNVQKDMSRVYYRDPYSGQRGKRPDCWSSNGIRPDDEVAEPVNPVCATCPNSAWRSGATAVAPNAQACQQRRRTVLVPYGDDLTNEAGGGPMLLSVPPGSLANQAAYREALDELEDGEQVGAPYFGVVTRLSYEQKDAKGNTLKFAKIKFDYLRQSDGSPWWLNDDEAQTVLKLREGEAVKRILSSRMSVDGPEASAGGDDEGGEGQVKAPPPRAATAPATPPVTPPKTQAASVEPKRVGGHAVTGITEAVKNPVEPPPSTRQVNTAAPKLRAVPSAPVDDGEREAHATIPQGTVFDQLMADEL